MTVEWHRTEIDRAQQHPKWRQKEPKQMFEMPRWLITPHAALERAQKEFHNATDVSLFSKRRMRTGADFHIKGYFSRSWRLMATSVLLGLCRASMTLGQSRESFPAARAVLCVAFALSVRDARW